MGQHVVVPHRHGLGRNLAQHGYRALAHVDDTADQPHLPVRVDAQLCRRVESDAAAIDHHAHPASSPDERINSIGALEWIGPTELGGTPLQTFLQPVAGERYATFQRLPVNDLVGWRNTPAGLPFRRNTVAQPERQRVHPNCFRRPIHQRLQREMALRRPQRPVAAGHRFVGSHRPAVETHVGAAIQVQHPLPRASRHVRRGGLVSPRVQDGVAVYGRDVAIST